MYAQWEQIKYTVTYNANGGNCDTANATVNAGESVTLPTPTRSNYAFKGWYTAASGGTTVGGAGDSYTPSANITLYAQWGRTSNIIRIHTGYEIMFTKLYSFSKSSSKLDIFFKPVGAKRNLASRIIQLNRNL